MDGVLVDLRQGFRLLRKAPGFALVAAGTLALGIGANTAIFSMVDAIILRALPYSDPDRVVMVWEDASSASFPRNTPAPANYIDWRRMNRSFSDMAATRGQSSSITGDGTPEQVLGRAVTPTFFPVLGVQPILGRTFTEDEDRAGAPVAIISYGLWQRRYGGESFIVGRTILLDDNKFEVIGVMPRTFAFRNREIDYWTPLSLTPSAANNRNSHFLNVVARLKPGVSVDAAAADMRNVAQSLAQRYPDTNSGLGAVVVPIKEEVLGNTRVELLVLMAAAAAVLLIACANLTGLLLSRAVGRRGELAIRAALGATRRRLVRQLVVESTVLALVGGILGLALAPAGITLVEQLAPAGFPKMGASPLDLRVLAFTFILSVATGLLFGAVPACQAARTSLHDALQQNTRTAVGGRSRFTRDALVVLQVAAALVLLVAAGLMLRTFANLRAIDIGFRSEHLLTLRTSLPRTRYADPLKRLAFYDRVIAGVQLVPGVERASFGYTLPFQTQGNTIAFAIEGRARNREQASDAVFRVNTNEYLQTLGVQLIEGRLIDGRDGGNAPPVVVINETMARQLWSGASALGHRMWLGSPTSPWRTIVGVVKDVRERGYEVAMKPGVYLPFAQALDTWGLPEYLVLRVNGNPAAFASAAKRIIASVDPLQPVSAIRTMDDIIDLNVADRHQQMTLLTAFAALALLLASVGLYGVLSYAVTQRRREIGLRIALGATRRAVLTMIVGRGLGLTGVGLAVGIAAAWGVTRLMNNLLYGVGATDRPTFVVVIALLGTVAMASCALPAIRASRVDPMVALRDQ